MVRCCTEHDPIMTVGELREVLAHLPDTAPVVNGIDVGALTHAYPRWGCLQLVVDEEVCDG